MAGLIAGLQACKAELAIVVGCDMPFLDPRLLDWLASQADGVDAVIPVVNDRPQYLHSIFRVAVLPIIVQRAAAGDTSLASVVQGLRARLIAEAGWEKTFPKTASFTNLNTPADLTRAELAGETTR